MKVPKSVGLEDTFLKWIEENRPEFFKNFSANTEALLKKELMSFKGSAIEFKIAEIARKISKLTDQITKMKLERESLEREIKFLQAEKNQEVKE